MSCIINYNEVKKNKLNYINVRILKVDTYLPNILYIRENVFEIFKITERAYIIIGITLKNLLSLLLHIYSTKQ